MGLLKIILAISLVFPFTNKAEAQSNEFLSSTDDLHQYLNVIHLKKKFNGEILVAKSKTVLFREAIGLASVEHNLTLHNGAKFRIASITKTFTGLLVALAQEENKLDVEDKVIHYIEGLSDKFREITIYQLLTHTSGLPHNEGIQDYWQVKSKLQLNTEQVIAEINELDLLYPPGAQMSYSSLGYYLLANILETVYGNEFQNILQSKILKKLQMEETGSSNTLKVIPHMATGYHLVNDDSLVLAPYRNYSMLKGAGDLYATSMDLLKWNNSFSNDSLLDEETKALMFTPQNQSDNEENYGYGWFIETEDPKKYYHGGGTWGYSTYTAIYPEDSISIIILSNISTLPIKSIGLDIEKIVFGEPFQMPEVEKEISKEPIDLAKYSGHFISDSGKMQLAIIKTNDSLFAQLAGNPPFEIYPKGDHQFFGKKIEIEITFELSNNTVTGLTAERMGRTFHFEKDLK